MDHNRRRLDAVTARDLMRSHVITIPETAPIREAIATFEDDHVTAIPVLDDAGLVVGLLREHDVVSAKHVRRSRADGQRGDYIFVEPRDEQLEAAAGGRVGYSLAELGDELVKDRMSPLVISVDPDMRLKAICELMRSEGIHRVLVLEQGALRGVVSTFDVIRYLARTL